MIRTYTTTITNKQTTHALIVWNCWHPECQVFPPYFKKKKSNTISLYLLCAFNSYIYRDRRQTLYERERGIIALHYCPIIKITIWFVSKNYINGRVMYTYYIYTYVINTIFSVNAYIFPFLFIHIYIGIYMRYYRDCQFEIEHESNIVVEHNWCGKKPKIGNLKKKIEM